MKKTFLIVIIPIVAGLIGVQIYKRVSIEENASGQGRKMPAVAVEIEAVRKESIRRTGHFTGTLYPRSQFVLAPKISGRVEKLHVNVGDTVRQDQTIAVLDSDEYRQQVGQAEAELEVAKANLEEARSALEIAEREVERTRALRKKKIASESELDAAEAQFRAHKAKFKVALAQVAQKQAALKASEVRLAYTTICVSCEAENGQLWVVGERFVDENAMLAPGDSIVSVLDIGTLIGVVYVIERDYPKVRVGQVAAVTTDAFPGRTFSGKVVRIAPLLREASRQARVEIEIPNPDATLKPGMFVRMDIEFERRDEATVVPYGALVNRNGRQGVFLADTREMKARFVPLKLGIIDGETAEVIEPRLAGSVITLGQHLLEDGAGILIPAESRPVLPVHEKAGGREGTLEKGHL